QHHFAGQGMTSVAVGSFAGSGLGDIAVGADNHVILLLHDSNGFSGAPVSLDLPDATTGLAVGSRRYGVDTVAVSHSSGVVRPEVTGGRIDVSTIADENDCINCDVAGLLAIAGTNGAPGGNQGVSLREAITAVNNDSVQHGTPGWPIGFAAINSAPSGAGHNQSLPQFAGPGLTNSFWVLQPLASAPGVSMFGNLPPLIAAATTIDGSLVDTSVNGVNNSVGPR